MKTLIKTAALLVTLTILFSVNLIASNYSFNDEAYIDDIPFNTTEVYYEVMIEHNLAEFSLPEEEYINDIPFNTECVTMDCLYINAVSVDFQITEDKYVDDIPFDTESVTANSLYKKAMLVDFTFEEEGYINDIEL